MSFRGINTTVIQIRRQVFTEVARMAYANVKGEKANHLMRKIPYTIIPGEEGKLRKDIFLERAIVEERVRLAMMFFSHCSSSYNFLLFYLNQDFRNTIVVLEKSPCGAS